MAERSNEEILLFKWFTEGSGIIMSAEFDSGVHSDNGGLTESHSSAISTVSYLIVPVKQYTDDIVNLPS